MCVLQANKMKPSIIFFDEIDALAPVRSVRQDQVHTSVVGTLLAEMDGLCDRLVVYNIMYVSVNSLRLPVNCSYRVITLNVQLGRQQTSDNGRQCLHYHFPQV